MKTRTGTKHNLIAQTAVYLLALLCLCLPVSVFAADEIPLVTAESYVQEKSVTLCGEAKQFQSTINTSGAIVSTSPDFADSRTFLSESLDPTPFSVHMRVPNDLAWNTVYYYKLYAGAPNGQYAESAVFSFRTPSAPESETPRELYRVRASWEDVQSQVGAFEVWENAVACADAYGLRVYDSQGRLKYAPVKVVASVVLASSEAGSETLQSVPASTPEQSSSVASVTSQAESSKMVINTIETSSPQSSLKDALSAGQEQEKAENHTGSIVLMIVLVVLAAAVVVLLIKRKREES